MKPLKYYRLLISPCPNDTYIFYALIHHKIPTDGSVFQVEFYDIQELNEKAKQKAGDIIKVSFYTYVALQEDYYLLQAGGALGRGCGPLLVARKGTSLTPTSLIGIPGTDTTANFLLNFYNAKWTRKKVMRFDEIMPAISKGELDAGVIIHESRFTYAEYGLECIEDLGSYWEKVTGLPIPLGGIIALKSRFSEPQMLQLEKWIQESILYALNHEQEVLAFCKRYAQEMSEEVMLSHIRLYVNEFSYHLGEEGNLAVKKMESIIQQGN